MAYYPDEPNFDNWTIIAAIIAVIIAFMVLR